MNFFKLINPLSSPGRGRLLTKADEKLCEMSFEEKIALAEAREIVKSYGSKVRGGFQYGYGDLISTRDPKSCKRQ